jgi:hypothetical protein
MSRELKNPSRNWAHSRAPLLIALWAFLSFSLLSAADSPTLTVDASIERGPISPGVYGANHGPWAAVSIDMLETAALTGVKHLRFPAGRWGDERDFTTQQLDAAFNQAQAWGAELAVTVRLEGGTPERAAEWVRYANMEKGYGIRDWIIGNEPDLYRDYTIEQLNADWRAFALAMKAVDPTIRLIGPEVSQFPPTAEGDSYTNLRREWVRAFLEANGDLVDVVSVHRYPFPTAMNAPATTADDLRGNSPQWDVVVENLRQVIVETMGREMPMAITEANSHWNRTSGSSGSPDSFFHAIWWADVLGRMIRQRMEIIDYFALSTYGDLSTYGLLDRYNPRPTWYVYQLYQQFGETLLTSDSTDPLVTVTAARRADGALTLMLVNRATEPVTHTLAISGFEAGAAAETILFDAAHNAESLGMAPFEGAVSLPAESITLLIVPPKV